LEGTKKIEPETLEPEPKEPGNGGECMKAELAVMSWREVAGDPRAEVIESWKPRITQEIPFVQIDWIDESKSEETADSTERRCGTSTRCWERKFCLLKIAML
jgi:hypothetical protein